MLEKLKVEKEHKKSPVLNSISYWASGKIFWRGSHFSVSNLRANYFIYYNQYVKNYHEKIVNIYATNLGILNQYSAKLQEYLVTIIVYGIVISIVYFRHLFVACKDYLVIHHDKITSCIRCKTHQTVLSFATLLLESHSLCLAPQKIYTPPTQHLPA